MIGVAAAFGLIITLGLLAAWSYDKLEDWWADE